MADQNTAKDVGLLLGTLFLARDLAHREHLKTTGPGSFARHSALGSFYEDIVGLADTLAETWQGRYLKLLDIPLVCQQGEQDILDLLIAQRDYLDAVRYTAVDRSETALQNIIDEIHALYCQTIYKLHFLA